MKLLTGVLSVLLLASVTATAVAQGRAVNEQRDIPATASVNIENMRGDLKIIGSDRSTAEVTGTLDEKAEGFTMEMRGNTLFIKVEMPRNLDWRGDRDEGSNLVVRIPQSVGLTVSVVSTDVEVADIYGGTQITSVSGDLTARSLQGNIRLNTVSGDVSTRQLAGDIAIETVSGDIDDRDATGTAINYQSVSGDVLAITTIETVNAQTVSGDVELDLKTIESLTVKNVSGDANIELQLQPNSRLEATSVSGDLRLTFAGSLDAQFELAANAGGDIINRITDRRAEKAKYGPARSLDFRVGEGSSTVKMNTVSGDIEVRKN
ncbi:MAG: DUF4097 family beta strand repeat-containing protein [Idiomarina sp.]